MAIKDYSTDPDLNVQISGINIAEGCPPSGINNAIRQLMADVKVEKDERDTTQAAKDAAQDEAIAAAQSSADAANQGLVDVVRSVNGVSADAAGNVVLEEVGTNYIRYTNGIQICFWGVSVPGGGASTVYTIPKAYKYSPYLTYTGHFGHINNSAISTTAVTMGNNYSGALSVGLITIGFWK